MPPETVDICIVLAGAGRFPVWWGISASCAAEWQQLNNYTLLYMDRRSFVKNGAVLGAAAAALPRFGFAQVKGSDRIKVALIGCGGRGTGAACNMIAADPNIKIVALGDLFPEKLDKAANNIHDFAKKSVGESKASEIIESQEVLRMGQCRPGSRRRHRRRDRGNPSGLPHPPL